MSFLAESQRKLILDLLLKRIPEERFFSDYPADPRSIHSLILGMLQRGLAEKDADAVDLGLMLMHRYGVSKDYLEVLHALALEPWHTSHENVVSGLAKIKDPSSVDVLARTAVAHHAYKEWDKAFALGTKSIYGLWEIQTPEAVAKLGELIGNKNRVLKSTAKELLQDIAKEGNSESARAAARGHLKKK
ncbi:MAG TPA: hypothetical protein VJ385_10945 [Fibrobacteria bacterium]|nr:hypothetical protein [Fibrobacteria bacterium]